MSTAYRADQVGSLLRPPQLLEARQAAAEGRLSAEGLREREDAAILEALEMQRQAGVDVYSDGEFRRGAWMTDIADAVEGFVPERIALEWHGPEGSATEGSRALVAGARLKQTRRLTAHEAEFLKEHASGPYKITLPAPSTFLHVGYKPGLTDRFYPTREEFGRDVMIIIRAELLALAAEGVAYLQLDAPFYSTFVDEGLREKLRSSGMDPDAALAADVALDRAALQGLARDGLTLAMHVCRGNSRSRWIASGGYERIAEQLLGTVPVDTFLLEYDDDRSGGFEPLRFIPSGATVVLGLISSKVGRLENQDDLVRRLNEAARFVPIDNLALSPQCGFASVDAGNRITADEQRRKLELVAQTARRVWG